jgi:hypothetical protein
VPSDVPVSLVFFVPITTGSTYNGKHNLWNGTTVCQGTRLAAFAPLGGAWCCFRLRLRLKGGYAHEHGAPTHLLDLWQ